MSEDLRLKVKRGAVLLDEELPGWEDKIDLSRLMLSHCEQCVLGQLYGSYGTGLNLLEAHAWDSEFARDHGFSLPFDGGMNADVWTMLGEFWREEIESRREAV